MNQAHDIALVENGEFYLCGSIEEFSGARSMFGVAKHGADGALDPGFAGDGIAEFTPGRDYGVAKRLALHGADALVVIGDIRDDGSFTDWAAIRVLR